MQQVHAYKDGNKWVIVIEDSEKDIDDVVKGLLSQLMAGSTTRPEQTENHGASRITPPKFIEKAKTDKETVPEVKRNPQGNDQCAQDTREKQVNYYFEKAVSMLRTHANNKSLLEKIRGLYGVSNVEELIATRSKEEIISLFVKC